MIAAIEWVLLLLTAFAVVTTLYSCARTGVPAVPSSPRVCREVAGLAREVLGNKPHPLVLDLGSGYGDLLLAVLRAVPGARGVGLEVAVMPWAVAAVRGRLSGRRGCFRRQRYEGYEGSGADLVVVYLGRAASRELAEGAVRLRPGTPVISCFFAITAWEPERVVRCGDMYRTPLYLYRVP
ncbi:MAG: hypothetical protein HYV63_09535 [Candidatus Schekmanbacteria bacterium]|nr:hypothetical protein [Candidatus Schekmanbacteria bacterium]